jgi:uncharacterized protein YrrD
MRSAKELKGLAVVDVSGGKRLGRIDEVVVSPDDLRVLGFVMKEGGLMSHHELVVTADRVRSMGPDAVTVEGDVALEAEQASEELLAARSGERPLVGAKAVTEDGALLGEIVDLSLDPDSMRIAAVTLRGGLTSSGDAIPAERIASVGPDAVIVRGQAKAGATSDSRSERDIRP